MGRTQKHFTTILLFLVGGLGLLSTLILLNEPLSHREALAPKATDVAQASSGDRRPASAPSILQQFFGKTSEQTISLNCHMQQNKLSTTDLRVRIKGQHCSDGTLSHMVVKNKTNGFVATIFSPKPGAFTTDFINLAEGQNEIELVFDNGKEPLKKTLTVVRDQI